MTPHSHLITRLFHLNYSLPHSYPFRKTHTHTHTNSRQVRYANDVACLFGDRVVQGFYDQGDVVSERERLTRGYCVRALQRSSCRELRGDECAKCMIEQECKATCYLNQEEKRIPLALEKQRVRPPSIRCVAPDSKEAKHVDVSIRIDDVIFPTNFTFSYHDPLHVLDITPRVSSCGGDFTLKLNESLKGVVSQAYVKFERCVRAWSSRMSLLFQVSIMSLKRILLVSLTHT